MIAIVGESFICRVSHKNAFYAQNNAMTIAFVAICVEVVMIAVLLPLKFTATVHFALSDEVCKAQIKFADISILRLKVSLSDGVRVQINGKTIKNKNRLSFSAVYSLLTFAFENKIFDARQLTAYVGTNDAKTRAILAAILQMPSVFSKTLVRECQDERFDAECGINVKINLTQFISAIAMSRERKYAKF